MRHASLTPDQVAQIVQMREAGVEQAAIAETLGVSASTVSVRLKRHGWTAKPPEFVVLPTVAAYCSGLFDGEGHVAIGTRSSSKGKWHLLKVGIANTCLEALEYVRSACGAGLVYRRRGAVRNDHPEWLPSYTIDFQSQWAAAFLRMVAPYALVKKAKIKVALEYADDVMLRSLYSRASLTAADVARRDEYRKRLRETR